MKVLAKILLICLVAVVEAIGAEFPPPSDLGPLHEYGYGLQRTFSLLETSTPEQKNTVKNARSTIGTATEISDYLRLLFARIGHTFSPVSGKEVKKDSVTDVVEYVKELPKDTKVQIIVPLVTRYNRSVNYAMSVFQLAGEIRNARQAANRSSLDR